ncbi:DoxX family protein [Methylobacterium sp. P1-11]|uniref:DoxX family protein n=1 Tax=Methylobacterium sp. P1-11 TaxID=2024616 RepID=UPI0024849F19|nr:DoxX family protein [Methylobacterium sp. P1-11]
MNVTTITEPTGRSRSANLGLWVLRIILGTAFVLAALMKLGGRQAMIDEFDVVGLGQWFRYFTGILELIGGIAVLVPAFSALAAILLLVVDLGAFVAQVTVLHIDWIHTVVIAALLAALIHLQRAALGRLVR